MTQEDQLKEEAWRYAKSQLEQAICASQFFNRWSYDPEEREAARTAQHDVIYWRRKLREID